MYVSRNTVRALDCRVGVDSIGAQSVERRELTLVCCTKRRDYGDMTGEFQPAVCLNHVMVKSIKALGNCPVK